MARAAQTMLKESLDALVKMDTALARAVRAADDEVDAMNRGMYGQVQEGLSQCPESIPSLIRLLSASRHPERMADLATNIAGDVIYMVDGEIVRHRTEKHR